MDRDLRLEDNTFKKELKRFLLYTALFCVFTAGIFAVLILSHRSVMQFHDAYKQGAFRLVELRNQLSNILSGAGFSFWSWYEGPGLDEPLENFVDICSIVGSLFPPRYLELGFTVAALLRMYLGGLAFIVLGREVKLSDKQIMLGALLYAFSSCFVGLALRQSEALINAYLFPLLVASVDKIYKGKSPLLFILTVAYYMLLAIYFAYMSAIAIIMYILLRYFAYNDIFDARDYLRKLGSFIGYGIIGILLTAFSSIFSAFTIMRASTESTSGSYGLLFDTDWYTTFGKMLLGTGATFDYSDIGPYVLVLMLLPIALRYCNKKATATIMSVILFAMMLIPFFSSMFNGFGYTTPRWSYTLLLFMIWSGMEQLDAEKLKDKKNIALAALGLVIIGVWTFGFYTAGVFEISRTGKVYVPIQLIAGLVLLLVLLLIGKKGAIDRKYTMALFIIPLISLSLGWSVGFRNNIENFARNSSVFNNLEKSALRAGNQIEDEGFYRIDSVDAISRHVEIKFPSNENIWWKTNNLIIYNSRIPKTLTDFNVALGNSYGYARRVFMLSNGNRPGLDFLFGVRYFLGNDENDIMNNDSDNYAGYGFEKDGEIDYVTVFRNKYEAGLGFMYDKVMPASEFEKLNRVQREQALLQAAVIPDDEMESCEGLETLTADELDFDIMEVPFEVTDTDGITVEGNSIKSDKRFASFTITAKDVPEGQLMISFDNMLRNTKEGVDGKSFEIHADNGRVKKSAINQHSRQGVAGLKDYDLSMGNASGEQKIRITLSEKGTYSFDKFYLSSMSNENYDRYAGERMKGVYKVSDYDNKAVYGSVDTDKDGILFLSIPAYDNWDVYIDDEKADRIDNIDITFAGVRVPAGSHEITLKYNNRYVKYGGVASIFGLALLVIILIARKRKPSETKGYKSKH